MALLHPDLADHPEVDTLTDREFRILIRDICAWSQGAEATPAVSRLASMRLVRKSRMRRLRKPPTTRRRRKIPAHTRTLVYARDGYRCRHCGTTEDLTIDHIFPWSEGGTDDEANLQTPCRPCNSRKGAKKSGTNPHDEA